jgi:uncharacterized membrane protein
MRENEGKVAAIILLSFIVGTIFYPQMPDNFASHWDIAGEVDGYMPKLWGVFLIPITMIVLLLFLVAIPSIDPFGSNIEKFRKYFDMFIIALFLFLLYIHILTLLWNAGFVFNIVQFLAPGFGFLLYFSGIVTENAKRNWFIGIQTPWTLSSEKVWNKTNKLGGKLLKASGIIAILGVLLPSYAALLIFIPVIVVAVFALTYSYVEYKNGRR